MAPDPRLLRSQRFPLHAAVEAGDLERVAGLLAGPTRSQIDRKFETSGQTPLHLVGDKAINIRILQNPVQAASGGCPALVQLLLDAGAGLEEGDCVKQTALHYSATNPRWGVMESLVRAGAQLNPRRMKDGWTPLFLATIFGHRHKVIRSPRTLSNSHDTLQVRYMVEAGADVLLCDDRGWTVMDWAAHYTLPAVTKLLQAAPRTLTQQSGKKYVEAEVSRPLQLFPIFYFRSRLMIGWRFRSSLTRVSASCWPGWR